MANVNNNILTLYFSLLRSAIWKNPFIGQITPEQADAVVNLAMRQGTAALIADQLLSSMHSAQLKTICAHNMMEQQRQRHMLASVSQAFTEHGISPVLIKGLTLAHYYPKPYLRQCGDIDIFVGKRHYHEGAKVLRDIFPGAPHFDTEEEFFKHYNIIPEGISIEMHRVTKVFAHPRDEAVYDILEHDALIDNPVFYTDDEDSWLEPEFRFNVLFVFIHSWEHWLTETACLRQLVDLTLLIASQPERFTELEDYLRINLSCLHLLRAWQLYAYIMVHYLGLPTHICPLYNADCANRAETLLEQILSGKPRRKKREEQVPKNVILRKLYTLRLRLLDALDVARIEPHYAWHMVITTFRQSYERFKRGENTRYWE